MSAETSRIRRRAGYTLMEVSLVVALLLALTAMIVPSFFEQLRGEELPRSGRQLRSLISLVRAHASFDGKRYRIRFAGEDEAQGPGDWRQPLIEREEDPVRFPEEFTPVTAPWAVQRVLLADVWCAEVRLGRPTVEELQNLRTRAAEEIERVLARRFVEDNIDPRRLPLVIEADGTSEWVTFVLTTAPPDVDPDEVEDYPTVHVIGEGETGLAWLQRPFYDEELDLFEEKNWPVVLRQDFLRSQVLTENDVLELREVHMGEHGVRMGGRRAEQRP